MKTKVDDLHGIPAKNSGSPLIPNEFSGSTTQPQATREDEEFEAAYKKVLLLCNCPAAGKPDPFVHAPNCPTRLALIQPRIPRTAHG